MSETTETAADRRPAPFVTVVVPTLDEEAHIRPCLETLLSQIEPEHGEILVMDGGSRDATRAIVAEMAASHPHLRLVDNPKRLQAAAVNLAAVMASPRSRALVRADAHALYPPNFVADSVAALHTRGAASTVVPMRTAGVRAFQRAVAAVQGSLLGNGGSAHRRTGRSAYVDHGHHAAFDRAAFLRLGGYDESFPCNEDAEYDHRLRRAGFRIWMCAEAAITYFPRDRPTALARQYFAHGRGRGRTVMRHRIVPKVRQMLPPAALVGSTGGLALALLEPAFLAVPALYVAICHGFAVVVAARRRDPALLACGMVAMIMHYAWSLGFLRSVAAGLARDAGSARASPATTIEADARQATGPRD